MDTDASSVERFILLVEDMPEHVALIQNALQDSPAQPRIEVMADGAQVVDFLHRRGSYSQASRPDMILLDLNLPGNQGHQVLSEIKTDPELRHIPIIVLTQSAHPEAVMATYALHGNSHVVKSTEPERLREIVQRIEAFWLRIVTLPLQ